MNMDVEAQARAAMAHSRGDGRRGSAGRRRTVSMGNRLSVCQKVFLAWGKPLCHSLRTCSRTCSDSGAHGFQPSRHLSRAMQISLGPCAGEFATSLDSALKTHVDITQIKAQVELAGVSPFLRALLVRLLEFGEGTHFRKKDLLSL